MCSKDHYWFLNIGLREKKWTHINIFIVSLSLKSNNGHKILSHIVGGCMTNNNGSGFNDWIYWHFFKITINYDSSQSVAVYDSLYSLQDHELLFFHCGEWRIIAHILIWLERRLPDESPLRMNYNPYITSRRPEYRSPSQMVLVLFSRCHGNVFVNIRCQGNLCLGTCYLATDVWLLTAWPRECVNWSVV
jgi:hypothetical protein